MRKLFLLIITLLASVNCLGLSSQKQSYVGPNALGPYRIDKTVLVRDLLRRLGQAAQLGKNHVCYRSQDGTAFFWFEEMAHHSTRVGDVMLSSFPNCIDGPVYITPEAMQAWKTEKGIGLGSTTQDILNAYGQPSKDAKIEGTAYRSLIQGDYLVKESRYANVKRPELGERALVYVNPDDLRSAAFGIREGKVVWISLGNSE